MLCCVLSCVFVLSAVSFAGSGEGGEGGSAQSLKCDQCGAILKDVAAAELHAHKVRPATCMAFETQQKTFLRRFENYKKKVQPTFRALTYVYKLV